MWPVLEGVVEEQQRQSLSPLHTCKSCALKICQSEMFSEETQLFLLPSSFLYVSLILMTSSI